MFYCSTDQPSADVDVKVSQPEEIPVGVKSKILAPAEVCVCIVHMLVYGLSS